MQVLKIVMMVAALVLLGMTLQGCEDDLERAQAECTACIEADTEWVVADEEQKLAAKCENGTNAYCQLEGLAAMNGTVEERIKAYIDECAVELAEGNVSSAEEYWEEDDDEVRQFDKKGSKMTQCLYIS